MLKAIVCLQVPTDCHADTADKIVTHCVISPLGSTGFASPRHAGHERIRVVEAGVSPFKGPQMQVQAELALADCFAVLLIILVSH